jgi:hypothetical protein
MGVLEKIGHHRYRIKTGWKERVEKWLSQPHIAVLSQLQE